MHPSNVELTRSSEPSSDNNAEEADNLKRSGKMEDMRHDANVESKILIQLENFGIPWNYVRYQTSEQTIPLARYKHGLKGYSDHI